MRKVFYVILTVCFVSNAFALTKYTYEMTEDHLRLMMENPYVSPTPSCDSALALPGYENNLIADYVIGHTMGNNPSDSNFPNYPNYGFCPPHNIYAYKISDPCSTGTKVNIVIMTGIHGSESSGTWTCQGMEDFCASDDPAAIHLRKVANIFVYPNANPDGRYLKKRDNPELKRMIADEMLPEGTSSDMNRVWHLYGYGLSTIDAIHAAMIADTGGQADYFFDYHGGSSQGASWFYIDPSLYDCTFTTEFEALKEWVPGEPHPVEHTNVERPGDYRMTRIWAMRADTLNAKFGATPENTGKGTPQDRFNLGRAYGLAVHKALTKGDPWHDYSKLNIESENWLMDNLVPLNSGQLEAQWNFDNNDASDSSGHGHDGSFVGNANIIDDPCRGLVLNLDGDGDYINCGGNGEGWAGGINAITVACWARIDAFTTSLQRLVHKPGSWDLERNYETDYMKVQIDGVQGSLNGENIDSVPGGDWHHIAFTYDYEANVRALYIDGVLDKSVSSNNPQPLLDAGDLIIGGTWNGCIDDVRIYNYAFTTDEIQQIYEDEAAQLLPPGQRFICEQMPEGDLNQDCKVNFLDFAIMASTWLEKPVVEEGILCKQYFSDNVSNYEFIDATWSHNLGGGNNRILIVALGQEDDSFDDMEVARVSFNNVEMKPVPGSEITTGYSDRIKVSFYYLLEEDLPQPGFYTVSVTYAGSVLQRLGGSISRSGVLQQEPICLGVNLINGQDTISTEVTTGSDNAWIVDTVVCDQNGSFSATSTGMIEHWDVSGDDGGTTLAGSSKETSGLTTMSWDYSSGANIMVHSIVECELLD